MHGYAAGHPCVDRPGRAVLGDREELTAGSPGCGGEPGPLLTEDQDAGARQRRALHRPGTGQIVDPDDGEPGVGGPAGESLDRGVVPDVLVTISDHGTASV